jgi:hypothetical protein
MQSVGLTDPYGAGAASSAPPFLSGSVGGDLSDAGGIVGGLSSGTTTGDLSAGLSAGKLAASNGAFGVGSGSAGSALGAGSSLLGLYQGLKTGGVSGDLEAGVSAGELGVQTGAISGAAGSTLGSAIPLIGAGLSLYNTVENWQSGNTGADALNGAETGASIGTAVLPGIGTVVGGVIGGAVGALSSEFGGGKVDPETTSFNNMVAANAKTGTNGIVSSLNPAQGYQALAGMMDAKNNTAGHSTALEMAFGRAGEGNLMTQMTTQINSAIKSGAISAGASPSQIYSKVVTPWLQSKNAYVSPNAIISSNGTKAGSTIDDLLTGLIGQWQSGALNSSSKVGVSGQTIAGLPTYG